MRKEQEITEEDKNRLAEELKISKKDVETLQKNTLLYILQIYARKRAYELKLPLSPGDLIKLVKERKYAKKIADLVRNEQLDDFKILSKEINISPNRLAAIIFVYHKDILTSPDDLQVIRKEAIVTMRNAMRAAMEKGKYQTATTIAREILAATQEVQTTQEAGESPTPASSFIYADFRNLPDEKLERIVSQKLREIRATNTTKPI